MIQAREPFVFWVQSKRDVNFPRTRNNTPDDFVVQLSTAWKLEGPWSVRVLSSTTGNVDPSKTHGDLMVYTDMIEYEIVGHDQYPLIERIYQRLHQESTHPFRRYVNGHYLETIGFKIADASGIKPVWTTPAQETVLCLAFTPQAENTKSNAMDQTFLSNQSKPFFPNNHASDFTAHLPALQRLNPEWRVGITKISLPAASTTISTYAWKVTLMPTFSIPPAAHTSFTLANINSKSSLITQFNKGMETMIATWFSSNDGRGCRRRQR